MLGIERVSQIGQRLAQSVSNRDQDRWHRVFLNMMEHPEIEPVGVVLEMARLDRTTFDAYLECRRLQPPDFLPTLRVTLFDIGKFNQAEAEMQAASDLTAAQ